MIIAVAAAPVVFVLHLRLGWLDIFLEKPITKESQMRTENHMFIEHAYGMISKIYKYMQ